MGDSKVFIAQSPAARGRTARGTRPHDGTRPLRHVAVGTRPIDPSWGSESEAARDALYAARSAGVAVKYAYLGAPPCTHQITCFETGAHSSWHVRQWESTLVGSQPQAVVIGTGNTSSSAWVSPETDVNKGMQTGPLASIPSHLNCAPVHDCIVSSPHVTSTNVAAPPTVVYALACCLTCPHGNRTIRSVRHRWPMCSTASPSPHTTMSPMPLPTFPPREPATAPRAPVHDRC